MPPLVKTSQSQIRMPTYTYNRKIFVRFVAVVFMISAATAFITALMRFINPDIFYDEKLEGSKHIIHYLITSMMVCTSSIGFINSCVVLGRKSSQNTDRRITTWLLVDSLFETSRVMYVFFCEMLLIAKGPAQMYDLLVSAIQYLLDSALYAHVVLGR